MASGRTWSFDLIFKKAFYLLIFLLVSPSLWGVESPVQVEVESSDPALRTQASVFFSHELNANSSRSDIAEAIRKFHTGRSIYAIRVYEEEDSEKGKRLKVIIEGKPRISQIHF